MSLEWTRKLPSGWSAIQLRRVATTTNSSVDKKSYDDGLPVRLCNYTDVYYNEYISNDMTFMVATATAAERRRLELRPGDVIITKDSESWDDIAIPACVNEPLEDVVCGYHLTVFRPLQGQIDGRFLLRVLQAQGVREQLWLAARGVTRYGLGQQGMRETLIPLPPLQVQCALADHLDRKTAAIDALIEKKERLLSLLAEKRAALIDHAVTRGLNPGVPMKKSGIDWVGEIPEHWEPAPLYSRYAVQLGKMLDARRAMGAGQSPYLRNANVRWDSFELTDLKTMVFSPADRVRFRLEVGDLMVCEGGANINVVGRSAVWSGELDECFYQKALHRLRRARPDESPRYLMYCMRAAVKQGVFIAGANANTVFHLTAEKLRSHRFPFPPANEQRRIVEHLDEVMRVAASGRSALQEQIQCLKEYRQALITAAVTGQLESLRSPTPL